MNLRKVTHDERGVFRRRRVRHDAFVSGYNEQFSCDGEVELVDDLEDFLEELIYDKPRKIKAGSRYGVSLMERKISDYSTINLLRMSVGV